MNVAVIGGGYAGMAAAVTLAGQRVPVTLYEAAKTLGGRARRVEHRDMPLDNGLHILIGAYTETLRLMRQVGADPAELLLRLPLTWIVHGRFRLRAASLPAPLHLLAGLAMADGATLADRVGAAGFMMRMRRRDYALERDTTVDALIESQGGTLKRMLWRPLCVSALNTPPATASAQVFLNVLRDGLAAGREASDLLLPRADLSRLFPEPAARYVEQHGGSVLTGRRVTAIDPAEGGYTVQADGTGHSHSHVICALAPYHAGAFLLGLSKLAEVAQTVERLAYRPIHSVYLQYPATVSLPAPMLGFDSPLLQWAFDRGALAGQHGLLGAVISAGGAHEDLAQDELGRLVHQELQQQLGLLPDPRWCRVIAEKRATFACTPGLERPQVATPLKHFYLAGDYTASDYPATIESAVRSGVAAARTILGTSL
jgi:squalene-associated FAD-dependent desaturase